MSRPIVIAKTDAALDILSASERRLWVSWDDLDDETREELSRWRTGYLWCESLPCTDGSVRLTGVSDDDTEITVVGWECHACGDYTPGEDSVWLGDVEHVVCTACLANPWVHLVEAAHEARAMRRAA